MTRIIISVLALILIVASFAGCGKTKTLHCDECGNDIIVDADSEMDEEWAIFCDECEAKDGLDTLVVKE